MVRTAPVCSEKIIFKQQIRVSCSQNPIKQTVKYYKEIKEEEIFQEALVTTEDVVTVKTNVKEPLLLRR